MSARPNKRRLSVPHMEAILAVASKLPDPFYLRTMLSDGVNAAYQVLPADPGPEGEKIRQEWKPARGVKMSTLAATMPLLAGYDVYGTFQPAELTGGDTFDLSVVDQGLLAVLADATGHGIAPALSVTQMHAMLRMAFRLGADLETAFMQVNNQLADILPHDRFITAFIGLLDPSTHQVRFHSGGQGPILHFRAASGTCASHKPTSFPLGAMRLSSLAAAMTLDIWPGDILLLLSDGIYEYRSAHKEDFGQERVEAIVRDHHRKPSAELASILLESVRRFGEGARQEDAITVVLVKREARQCSLTGHSGVVSLRS